MKRRNVIFLLWLFCGVYYTASAFTVDAGEDQSVFVGATTVLGGSPTASDGKEPYSYTWTDVSGNIISQEANPMLTVVSGTNNYFVEVLDGNGISCIGEFVTVVGEAKPNNILLNWVYFNNSQPVVRDDVLQNINFNDMPNDDNNDNNVYQSTYNTDRTPKSIYYTPIIDPGWNRMNNTGDPICYVSGDLISVAITLEYSNVSGSSDIEILGIADGGFEFSANTTVNGTGTKTLIIDANTALPANEVNMFAPFRITWNISEDGGQSYKVIGKSANFMYVVYDTPNLNVINNGGLAAPLFESLLNFSCYNAQGANSKTAVIDAVWNGFSNFSVFGFDGLYLNYYKNYNNLYTSTQSLLKYKDGQCSAWATFFIDALKMQGIHNINNYIFMNHNGSYYQNERWFFVKNWEFGQNGTPHQPVSGDPSIAYSHENWVASFGDFDPEPDDDITNVVPNLVPTNKPQNEFYFIKEEVKDLEGVRGQNNLNPKSIFQNHQLVFLAETGMYYDPSYFLTYTGPSDFDNQAISAYSYIDEILVNGEKIARMHIRENQPNTTDISISTTGSPVPNTY